MSDLTLADAEEPMIVAAAPEADAEAGSVIEPAVAYVMPASVYEMIDTEDGEGPEPGPEMEAAPIPSAPPVFVPIAVESPQALEAIHELGRVLNKQLEKLQTSFDREVRNEANREKVVDRLHAELQEYKQDLLLKVLKPVFVDMIQLHDDIGKMAHSHAEQDGEVGRMIGVMLGYQQGIEDILYRQGVEPFTVETDVFDPRRQRAVSTVPTDDPALNKTVAARIRKGFQSGDKVIRPEIVSVHALRKQA